MVKTIERVFVWLIMANSLSNIHETKTHKMYFKYLYAFSWCIQFVCRMFLVYLDTKFPRSHHNITYISLLYSLSFLCFSWNIQSVFTKKMQTFIIFLGFGGKVCFSLVIFTMNIIYFKHIYFSSIVKRNITI